MANKKHQPKTVSVIPFLIQDKKKEKYTLMIGRADDENGEYERLRISKAQFSYLIDILQCTVREEDEHDITFSHE